MYSQLKYKVHEDKIVLAVFFTGYPKLLEVSYIILSACSVMSNSLWPHGL